MKNFKLIPKITRYFWQLIT